MITNAEELVEKHGVEAIADTLTYLYDDNTTNWSSQMESVSQKVREIWDAINSKYVLVQEWRSKASMEGEGLP